jgi:hypothetical protein
MNKFLGYLKARLLERSFWGDVVIACSAAAILPKPWNFVTFVALSVMKGLVPDGSMKPGPPKA